MFKLSGETAANFDIDCGNGIVLTVKPHKSSALRSAARREASLATQDDPENFIDALIHAYGRRVIVAWTGVGDAAGNAVEPTPDLVDELLNASDAVYRAFDTNYVGPALDLEAEKNVSSPGAGGTSGKGAGTTARAAAKPAKSARASSTRAKPMPAKGSGKS